MSTHHSRNRRPGPFEPRAAVDGSAASSSSSSSRSSGASLNPNAPQLCSGFIASRNLSAYPSGRVESAWRKTMTSPLHRSTPRASCAARPLSGETSTASAPALCATETVASSLPPSTTTTSQ